MRVNNGGFRERRRGRERKEVEEVKKKEEISGQG